MLLFRSTTIPPPDRRAIQQQIRQHSPGDQITVSVKRGASTVESDRDTDRAIVRARRLASAVSKRLGRQAKPTTLWFPGCVSARCNPPALPTAAALW